MTDPRRTFAPVVLLGLASAGGAAVAGTKDWATTSKSPASLGLLASQTVSADMPLAGALAFVLLAAWGVLLVTRGGARRLMAVVTLVVAAVLVAVTVVAYLRLPDTVAENYRAARGAAAGDLGTTMTGWYWVALVAAVLAVVAATGAVRFARHWPEMGSRYDAPTAHPAAHPADTPADSPADTEHEPATETDLWKAMDAGHDPTERPDHRAP
ncbi:Trp biosynthesis-associated membrane protein [Marmoricola sp. RAF53]|uniref:Trp biosynthesis-associated membrane protein n=1 Tax=Marmoricola sp. RAF53 TaxID=3233059 RepID=UPI003F9A52DC